MDTVLELLLPCELRGLTPHIRLPPKAKVFWGMFPFKHQYRPSSHQLKHNIFVFFLCLSLNLFRISPSCVYCYIWLCILAIFFMELLVAFFLWYTLWKLFRWALIQQNTFLTHTDLCVRETEHKWMGCLLQYIKIQTQYTIRHNTLMPYNIVLQVSVHQNCHQAPIIKKHYCIGNIHTLRWGDLTNL